MAPQWKKACRSVLIPCLMLCMLVSACGSEDKPSPAPTQAPTPTPDKTPIPTPPGNWKLVWADEFDMPNGSPIDTSKWTFDTGGGGWGNNELQFYTDRKVNTYIENGHLVIMAQREDYGDNQYTSARVHTHGKFAQTYGRIEARIKLPHGHGIWPAFWMLGSDFDEVKWPNSGEIDIMEHLGREPSRIYGSLHGPGYFGATSITSFYELPYGEAFAGEFHVFAVEWEVDRVRFLVDDHLYAIFTTRDIPAGQKWVFDHPFFILLNVAVGGNWPGNPDDTTVFPQYMSIDYVRVYSH